MGTLCLMLHRILLLCVQAEKQTRSAYVVGLLLLDFNPELYYPTNDLVILNDLSYK